MPKANCRPGDKPDTALQGQIPLADRASGRAEHGYNCNLTLVGSLPARTFSGFERYEHCAYLADETWASAATQTLGLGGVGVRVVDMSDSTQPQQTALLTSRIAIAPDEAMAVNARRGLLVMNSTFDSQIDVYDLEPDCAHPKLVGTFDMAPAQGHAGWFSPDGNVYWMTRLLDPGAHKNLFPIDLTDPAHPKLMAEWETDPGSGGHNGWTSDDGKTTYACQISTDDRSLNRIRMFRSPTPGAKIGTSAEHAIGSFPLEGAVCQDAKAVTYGKRRFVIANSEYTVGRALQHTPSPCGLFPENLTNYGVPEIVDVSNPKDPRVVSHLMLEVDDPANCVATMNDRGDGLAGSAVPGEVYDTHFCRPDRLHNPTILACERFLAGLQVYDIRDPFNPKELAYFRTGTLGPKALDNPDWAATPQTVDDSLAPPIVNAERGEIWFTNFFTGLKVVRLPKSVYPFKDSLTCENDWYFNHYNPGLCPEASLSSRDCIRDRAVTISVRGIEGSQRARSFASYVNGKRTRVVNAPRGARIRVRLDGVRRDLAEVRVVARLTSGKRVADVRRYRLCHAKSSVKTPQGEGTPPVAPRPDPAAAAAIRKATASAGSEDLRLLCVLVAAELQPRGTVSPWYLRRRG